MVYHFTALTASPYAARHRQRIPGWLRDKACAHICLKTDVKAAIKGSKQKDHPRFGKGN